MITGGCLCGAIRFRASSTPVMTRICWCRVCQKLAAGSGTVNAAFATECLIIEGVPADHESVADSGNGMHRRFCATCGTPLFSHSEARPEITFIRVGAFDDPELAQPAAAIWVDSAPRWACLDSNLPRFGGAPPSIVLPLNT